jgi:hypothetical protein
VTDAAAVTTANPFSFQPWPKLPRLNREIIVTEKIDGTNAAIQFDEDGNWATQSRKRLITPGKDTDNYGFAAWVEENHEDLFIDLGPGIHFGEWWGKGILRNYGLDHRRFSLFNTSRWAGVNFITPKVRTVPVLYRGPNRTAEITLVGLMLRMNGSVAMPGFDKPEGIVVFHTAANQMFKVTLEDDENPKSVLPGAGDPIG